MREIRGVSRVEKRKEVMEVEGAPTWLAKLQRKPA